MPETTEQKIKRQHVERTSAPILDEQIAKLRQVFPEAVSEGKIDFDKLRTTLGDSIETRPDRFSFTWAGKQDAIALLQTPSRATLIPCPEESVNFDATQHLFIEGDNLEVLKLLFKPYFGWVKMIYIDPPYNTGQDFIYPDNYADPLATYLQFTGQVDSAGNLLTSNPETSGRYHSTWLSMMYPRLFLARQLLSEDGVIFVSIDDHEVHHLRMLMNEVFGEENFVATIIWQHSIQAKGYTGIFSVHHNYILCYRKSEVFTLGSLERTEEHNKNYSNPDNDPKGSWRPGDVRNALYRPNLIYDIITPSGKKIAPPEKGWRWSKETVQKKIETGEIIFSKDESRIIRKIYLSNVEGRTPETIWFGKEVGTTREAARELKTLFGGETPFDTPKPTTLIRKMIELANDEESNGIYLDFFAGSCPTGQAILELNRQDSGNRQVVIVQLPEPTPNDSVARKLGLKTIAEVGEERVRRVIAKLNEADKGALQTGETPEDLGFKVFKLAASNYEPWTGVPERDAEAYIQQMSLFTDPLVKDWKPVNVIWEVAIKEGYGLNSRIEPVETGQGNTVYRVTDRDKDQSFRICLDDKIKPGLDAALKLGAEDLFICRDKAIDDTEAANLALQCWLKTI
jgi:adenine-specific DNA-methyltransferase